MVPSLETALSTRRQGFTLIELLVVIVIIVVLAVLHIPAVAKFRSMARASQEQAMGRSLMVGVFNYAADHGGEVIHGYCKHPIAPEELPIQPQTAEEVARYPLRLIKYIGSYDKRIMVAESKGWFKPLGEANSYDISVFPSMGMNIFYVGGDESGNDSGGIKPIQAHFDRFGKFCITHIGDAQTPSRQIVFVSARTTSGGLVPGYFKVVAPKIMGAKWAGAPFTEDSDAGQYGYVDFRYDGKAIVAHLDGHVEKLDETALRDMRRWSDMASRADDPNWSL
ncbi:MAG: prepilin-type N-terminal cleavage/methylation domain-containing protein [Verrucomicrobia bacterium]|nr:prepilin-type N-terminal cleavage/methylation domain-containing protein [Verrucomicrobiota bacterium]